jgi:hypothetical protein
LVQTWAFQVGGYLPTGVVISISGINQPGMLAAAPPGGL